MVEGQRDKLKPCTGVMVWKGDMILLGKRRGSHGNGEYSFPGGHLEFDESFVECIERETLEEAGIKIKNIKFLSVANYRKHENRQDILISFTADLESGKERTDPDEKIGDWGWYKLDDLPTPIFYPTQIIIDSYKTGRNFYDKE